MMLGESAIRVEAGIGDLPLATKLADASKHVKLKISWSTTAELPQ